MPNPKTLDHPTFGSCKLIPSLALIRWKAPVDAKAISSVLTPLALKVAENPAAKASGEVRNPAVPAVNNSSFTTWVTGGKLAAATLQAIAEDSRVDWIAPAYRRETADAGEGSYFGINPTTIVLTAQSAAIADVAAVDSSAMLDDTRTNLMKGFVVYRLPKGNAIDVATQLRDDPAIRQLANAVSFENIPYLSPTCGGCGCTKKVAPAVTGECSPPPSPHLPTDSLFAHQWGLQRIDAPRAWPISKGDPNVVIAVLDSGVELGHPDLNLWPVSYSTITHTNNGSPVGNHGTACAGIISSKMDNGIGAAGLAPECRVMAIATILSDVAVAEGLFFAADNGAHVVSMSFGFSWSPPTIEAALQYCHDKNIVLVAAMGNSNGVISPFPASDPRVLGVGGSNRDDVRKRIGDGSSEPGWGANYGPACDVVAPCIEIPTTDRLATLGYAMGDYYLKFSGTSAAAPHVAALAGLILSVNKGLANTDVCRIIAESADKINAGSYAYVPTVGKPFGTWNNEVGYGRINAERAVLLACASRSASKKVGSCGVDVVEPEECCVSPCDPPWRPGSDCLVQYEEKFFRQTIGKEPSRAGQEAYIEFRFTYEHRMCLLGKQHGPLLFTTTLVPGETVRLYHSERYRRTTSTQERYSVRTTFTQFISLVHQARVSNSLDSLSERLQSSALSSSSASGGGFSVGPFSWKESGSVSTSSFNSSRSFVRTRTTSEVFLQSVLQASQLTQAERSIVISTYEDRETLDVTARTLHNANECRAVTYFVRQVMELYEMSTRLIDISVRVIAPNVFPDWHAIDDLGTLPTPIVAQILTALQLLPQIGEIVVLQRPLSVPTDGVVYDPELANCCSCEPERAAAIQIRLEKAKAEAMKVCMEVKAMELELERRRLLLAKGELGAFDQPSTPMLPPTG